MRPERRLRLVVPLLIGSAGLLSACGSATIRPDATERTVATFVYRHTGFRPTDVKCPSGVPAKVGGRFQCQFTGPDGPYTAYLRILSVHGEHVVDYIVTKRTVKQSQA